MAPGMTFRITQSSIATFWPTTDAFEVSQNASAAVTPIMFGISHYVPSDIFFDAALTSVEFAGLQMTHKSSSTLGGNTSIWSVVPTSVNDSMYFVWTSELDPSSTINLVCGGITFNYADPTGALQIVEASGNSTSPTASITGKNKQNMILSILTANNVATVTQDAQLTAAWNRNAGSGTVKVNGAVGYMRSQDASLTITHTLSAIKNWNLTLIEIPALNDPVTGGASPAQYLSAKI